LLALRSAPPIVDAAEARILAREVYGLTGELHPLSGERDCNFHVRAVDGREFVLKVLGGSGAAAECQVRVLRHLAEQDPALPVPRVEATRQGTDLGTVQQGDAGYPVCLVRYLPGRLLADVQPNAAAHASVGQTMAGVDSALQGFFHPALGQPIAWDVRRLPELMEFVPYIEPVALRSTVKAVAGALEDRLPQLRGLRAQAIHGDCHGGNLLIDDAGTSVCGVLDFGDMIHAPLILEVAVAMTELMMSMALAPDELTGLLGAYTRRHGLDAAEIECLYDLIAARHATTIMVHAWRGRHDAVGARLLDRVAGYAVPSLDRLQTLGRGALTRDWHRIAGTAAASRTTSVGASHPVTIDVARRHRLLGAGAELFYDEPLHLVRGDGVWLYDPRGRAYLDVYNNVAHVGHSHPTVVQAIERQTATLATHTRYLHERILDYAERLTATCPAHLDACIFVNSGSEANDIAWRLAKFASGHAGAVVMAHAYHGITDAVAALTPGVGQPQDSHVVTLGLPPAALRASGSLSAEELAAATAEADRAVHALAGRGVAPAAFFLDTALTSSGILDPPPQWGAAVTARIRAAGGLIVADEVQYGFGRSGSHFWGFERRGLSPDIVTLGKPVGNGYPMGVVIAGRHLIEAFQARFGFFSTFGGNPVAAAAGLAVLDVLERERLVENALTTGGYLRRRLESLAAQHACLGAVHGAGLLVGLEIRGPDLGSAKARTKRLINALVTQARILTGYEGPHATFLKLRPPLTFRPEHADLLVQAIGAAAVDIDRPA
jgi:4-aminobutyrate aminotransferase-like enzyme/Ser/Thr protein kinase RdoA (MazF antagonist)